MLWRLGGFGAVVFGNTAELGARGFCSSSRLSVNVGRYPGWSKVHDGDVEGVGQTCRGTPASPILV